MDHWGSPSQVWMEICRKPPTSSSQQLCLGGQTKSPQRRGWTISTRDPGKIEQATAWSFHGAHETNCRRFVAGGCFWTCAMRVTPWQETAPLHGHMFHQHWLHSPNQMATPFVGRDPGQRFGIGIESSDWTRTKNQPSHPSSILIELGSLLDILFGILTRPSKTRTIGLQSRVTNHLLARKLPQALSCNRPPAVTKTKGNEPYT